MFLDKARNVMANSWPREVKIISNAFAYSYEIIEKHFILKLLCILYSVTQKKEKLLGESDTQNCILVYSKTLLHDKFAYTLKSI